MSKNEILDGVFVASAKMELLNTLICVLIEIVENRNIASDTDAVLFASQQGKMGDLLHIAIDEISDIKSSLEEIQDDMKGGVA